MLHLQAGVDLQERDGAALAQQKLHRACAHVACGGADVARSGVDAFALGIAQKRSGGLFHQLLVAPLQRAVARAQHHHVAVGVGQHLGLDVAGLVEELLHKALAPAKGGDGFAHGGFIQLGYFVHAPRDLHAPPTAAKRGLDDDGQAVLLGKGQHLARVLHRVGRAHHQRCTHLQGDLARFHLVAQLGNGGGARANPGQACVDHGLGKGGVFRKEAVARVHRIGPAFFGDGQELFDVQVGVCGAVTVQPIGFIGHAGVQRVDVGIGIHSDGLHAVVGAGAGDADGDLASVGDQDFFHRELSNRCQGVGATPAGISSANG